MNKKYFHQLQKILYRKSLTHAVIIALTHVMPPFFVAYIHYELLQNYFMVGISVLPFVMIFIATRFRAINNMSHECIHYSFCSNRQQNEIFGEIFSILEFSKFKSIRHEHMAHHRYLGDFQKDLDFKHLKRYGFWRPLNRATLKEHIFRSITLRHLPNYLFLIYYDKDAPLWSNISRILYISLLLIMGYFHIAALVMYVILPYVSFYQMHKYFIDVLDHGGLLNHQQEVEKTRNFILKNKIVNYLFFPRADGYHLIHHLMPALPIETFKKAHNILLQDPHYFSLQHSAREQIEAWLARRSL